MFTWGLVVGGTLQGLVGRRGCWGGAGASKLPFMGAWPRPCSPETGGQRVGCCGQGSRTGCSYYTIQDIGPSLTGAGSVWICQSALHTKNGIILAFMFMVIWWWKKDWNMFRSILPVSVLPASYCRRMDRPHTSAEPVFIVSFVLYGGQALFLEGCGPVL